MSVAIRPSRTRFTHVAGVCSGELEKAEMRTFSRAKTDPRPLIRVVP